MWKRLWAIRIRYMTGDGKWHKKTTHWYEDLNKAWTEHDEFLMNRKDVLEASGAVMHKEGR